MKKQLLLVFASVFMLCQVQAQTDKVWSSHNDQSGKIVTAKGVARLAFPKEFKLFDLNIDPLRQQLFSVNSGSSKHQTIITLPNAAGKMEQFEVYEASNFEADLQAQFPEIRAYSGKGITDKYATLKLSISPQGIQTMVFRTDKENEFMEPYSQDAKVYAVYNSQREIGKLAWTCSTADHGLMKSVDSKISETAKSNAGQMKTMRLAQSCNGEYANYFGATSSAQVALVMAAFNATITRCNGVYEKDLALHLNLVASTTNVIYYTPGTDPYTTLANWNTQLQNTLNQNLTGPGTPLATNNAAYDIGHMFGSTGGGGNAGCIGCVCEDGVTNGNNKGSGITSPIDGIPQGDNFDIDFVVHEVGHQLGGNHTFSHNTEGSGVNMEVGSGVTIMGYAGITGNDVAPHSIDKYHAATIMQIQNNLATKTCPITTNLAATNATPTVNAGADYTIPISTPYVLTAVGADANAGDALTYSWEQFDDCGANTGANSNASITKVIGPNFISWNAVASPSRYFPKIASVIASSATTAQVGGDAGMLSEALSSVARTLNFRVTVRDNAPYSSTAPIKIGQTNFDDMKVTVSAAAGPFVLNIPSATALSYAVGTNQSVTWNVANTNTGAVNTPYVDLYLSTDGGNTYPILLASKVPNDGAETVSIPNNVGTTNRIMAKGFGNVFFDISNNNFAITAPPSTFNAAFNGVAGEQNKGVCQGANTVNYTFDYTALAGFVATTNFTATGVPANTTVTFSPTSRTTTGPVTMTVTTTATTPVGTQNIIANATSGAKTLTVPFYLEVAGAPAVAVLSAPANNAISQNTTLNLTWAASANATGYDVQVATDLAFTAIISSGSTATTSYTVGGLAQGTSYYWRVKPTNASCVSAFGSSFKFTTGMLGCATTAAGAGQVPKAIGANNPNTKTSTIAIAAGGTIADVNVTMNITHTWAGDLVGTLQSPSGTIVQLFSRPCDNDATNGNIVATFDDAGGSQVCPGITGTVAPTSPLSAFNNSTSTGTWTLTIDDVAQNDGGTINSWSLNICTIQPLSVEENQFQNFSLFPNPNNGNFTLKFNSASDNDIKIIVHDLRGRQVYEKSFSNEGNFNQNINLDKVQSGVYLVSVLDGDQKIVKRIIIE
ncbi:reprolysin-like metallopeptidase [Flavobacterium sp.]|uniref:zinc-dependent metalloprotease n=1 Tax=Flavobacterium sp. TaxID=239 RepID=UPI0026288578|nr:zinc-dependent metalloprotease family protein [Flavobacterium sp.]